MVVPMPTLPVLTSRAESGEVVPIPTDPCTARLLAAIAALAKESVVPIPTPPAIASWWPVKQFLYHIARLLDDHSPYVIGPIHYF